jgi:Glycosyl hydrolase catalytic core
VPVFKRCLILLLIPPAALAACGGSSPRPRTPLAHEGPCQRIELERVSTFVGSGRVSLSWTIASTADVSRFLVEQKLGGGRWTKRSSLPTSRRTVTLGSLPRGRATFRVWAVLNRRARRASVAARRPRAGKSPARRASAQQPRGLAVGLNAGYWGSCEPAELRSVVEYIRLDTPPNISRWSDLGLQVIADESGPYQSDGVAGLDRRAYVAKVLAFVAENPQVWAIEVLNEPGGQWFWGDDAESEANRSAYAQLVIAVHDALLARFGASRPLVLASYDGGQVSSNAWGEAWTQNATALADADMLTVHPYAGTDDRASYVLGDRAKVQAAHAKTGKPIAITEVGFATKGAGGDVPEISEAEQAGAVAGIVAWARTQGYVKAIVIYNYRDTGEGGGYGVQKHDGTRKPAWPALARAAAG